ncbi:MAG TPA: HAMP domain-containing sensor histidine kinase [Bacteroidia bacterium]|nr:HAMP domain-containing sensor histidine kinase [Bacteroidia bacterium]
MKLQLKLVLYNAFSKAIIILAIGAFLPIIIRQVVYNHIDKRLIARSDKVLQIIRLGGLNEIMLDQDCSYGSYNIFKEEFINIEPLHQLDSDIGTIMIEDDERQFEDEILKHRVLSEAFLFDNQLYNLEIGEGLSTVEQLNNTIWSFIIWTFIAVVVVSVFIDVGFSRMLMRPFYRIINRKLRDTQHPTQFETTPVKTNTYEFSYLDQSINEMMNKIKDTFLVEKEFINNASHELLTPISVLQNRFENILAEKNLPDDVADKIVESLKTLHRLSKTIKALLLISKIENSQFLKNEDTDVRLLTHEVLAEIGDRVVHKNIYLEEKWDDDFVFHHSNKSLLHTLILNLINNAIKYNKTDGKIFINGFMNPEKKFVLKISDTGVGIEQEDLKNIFGRFKRFRPEDGASFGLGLPIVQTIASFHGLEISVESEKNKGSTFSVVFPSIPS